MVYQSGRALVVWCSAAGVSDPAGRRGTHRYQIHYCSGRRHQIARHTLGRRMVPSSATTPTQPEYKPGSRGNHIMYPVHGDVAIRIRFKFDHQPTQHFEWARAGSGIPDWLHHGSMPVPARTAAGSRRNARRAVRCANAPTVRRFVVGNRVPRLRDQSFAPPTAPPGRSAQQFAAPASGTAAAGTPWQAGAGSHCSAPAGHTTEDSGPHLTTESPFNYRYRALILMATAPCLADLVHTSPGVRSPVKAVRTPWSASDECRRRVGS